ncbi:MAG: DUF5063 domain-containing protein [Bacteroidales bacterium]
MKDLPIYSKQTVEFVTVGAEYCAFIEKSGELERVEFVDKCVKLLPLLYLKAVLLPETEYQLDEPAEQFVTEEMYEYIRGSISRLLGAQDDYLEVFIDDMQYSENPINSSVSEDLTDIYQDIKDFISVYSMGYEATMNDALARVNENFREYWGQKLVNGMRPLHAIRFGEPIEEENENSAEHSQNSNWLFENQRNSSIDDLDADDWSKWDNGK